MNNKFSDILDEHLLWNSSGWKDGVRARFFNQSFIGDDLRGAYLPYSIVNFCDFYKGDLRGINFFSANLRGCVFNLANLNGANLAYAILCGSDLTNADLTGASLFCTDLRYINSTDGLKGKTVLCVQVMGDVPNRLVRYWVEDDVITAGHIQASLKEFEDMEGLPKGYREAIEYFKERC